MRSASLIILLVLSSLFVGCITKEKAPPTQTTPPPTEAPIEEELPPITEAPEEVIIEEPQFEENTTIDLGSIL
jgi:PBP1b-binding outer membrane lipoprotein LpoB